MRGTLEIVWLGFPLYWRRWHVHRPTWESTLVWEAWLGPVLIRRYK